MSELPTFSVVVPLYQKAGHVVDAVRSALEQSPSPLEVIVVDDGSTDGGGERVRAMGDERVRVVTQQNAGVAAARNAGIGLARAEYVAFLDADDRYDTGFLSAVSELIRRYPDAAMFCTGFARIDPQGRRSESRLAGSTAGELALVPKFHQAWLRRSFTFTSAIVVRRGALMALWPPFPVDEQLGEDQDLWFRIAETYSVAYANVVASFYFVDVAGSATTISRVTDPLPCYVRLAQRIQRGAVPRLQRAGARRLVAAHWLNVARARFVQGDRKGALHLLFDARAFSHPSYWLRTSGIFCLAWRHTSARK